MAVILVPGQSGTLLDIYIKSGTVLYDPPASGVLFTITDANGALQGTGSYSGYKRSIGHYDASNFIVTTSGALGAWSIIWSIGGASKTEAFTVQNPTLTEEGDYQNSIDKLKEHIRFDIGDFQKDIFSNYQLEVFLDKSVKRLNRALGISYKVRPTGITPGGIGKPAITPPISIDILGGTIFPNTDEIKDLVVLQAEVLITRAEMGALRRASAASAAAPGSELIGSTSGITADNGAGIVIRNADGVQIDTSARLTSWLSNKTKLFIEEAKAREVELENAIFRLRANIADSSSKVIY